jgi:hypothetical protein
VTQRPGCAHGGGVWPRCSGEQSGARKGEREGGNETGGILTTARSFSGGPGR